VGAASWRPAAARSSAAAIATTTPRFGSVQSPPSRSPSLDRSAFFFRFGFSSANKCLKRWDSSVPAQNSLEVDDPRDRHEIPRHEIKKVSVPCSPSCVKSNLVLVSTICCYLVFFFITQKKKKKKNASSLFLHVVECNS